MNNAAWTTFNNRVPYLKGTPVPKEPEVVNRPRCGATIQAIHFKDYVMCYCPEEQTGGRVLKDRRLSRLLR